MKTNQTSRATRAFAKAMATRPEGKYFFRLYVAGATTRSRQALRRVYQQPELARDNQIVATPTLVKEVPLPPRRFIGNLLNITRLFVDLDLIPEGKIAV